MPHYLTVGELKRALEGMADGAPVFYERIEDVYFEKHGWPLRAVPDLHHERPDYYVQAFSASPASDGSALYITAHY